MYQNIEEMCSLATERKLQLWEVICLNEMRLNECDESNVFERMKLRLSIMKASSEKALEQPCETIGSLINGFSQKQNSYASQGTLCGSNLNLVMARAMSASEVNASMGRICAAPTAGACGILPAVLFTVGESLHATEQDLIEALIVASGIGAVIVKNATVSGAEGGCQAECGVAAAMAAAAAITLVGGSEVQIQQGVAIALINCMGLICDPVAGLVAVPCIHRNASQAIGALVAADMALAGIPSVIPVDEVIEAMLRVGKQLPEALRETAQGGIAVTPTGKKIKKEIFG